MLILTRKVGETVLIGDNIRIMVVQVRGENKFAWASRLHRTCWYYEQRRNRTPKKSQKSQAPEIILPTNTLGRYRDHIFNYLALLRDCL